MKAWVIGGAIALLSMSVADAAGSHRVRAHTTRSGTYVPSHRATNRDATDRNNWSTKPNTNPYTGRAGTRSPGYKAPSRRRY